MDGNGRWASKRGLPRIAGHRAGVESIRRILPVCEELGIKTLTLYAFSNENWTRPKAEIKALMMLLNEFIDRELKNLMARNAQLQIIGNTSELPEIIQKKLRQAVDKTASNSGIHLNLAINYGGRQEILRAVNLILKDCQSGKINENDIDPDKFSSYLYTKSQPDPDLIIRTSGEKRLSNFLLWQLSYSEIFGTDVLWPDFREHHLREAIDNYQMRERRYGDVKRDYIGQTNL